MVKTNVSRETYKKQVHINNKMNDKVINVLRKTYEKMKYTNNKINHRKWMSYMECMKSRPI